MKPSSNKQFFLRVGITCLVLAGIFVIVSPYFFVSGIISLATSSSEWGAIVSVCFGSLGLFTSLGLLLFGLQIIKMAKNEKPDLPNEKKDDYPLF